MTNKEKILNIALELFAINGYDATSTKSIAQKAKVSEGLIFSHYQSKKGLLEAINQTAENKIKQIFTPIIDCLQPKKAIGKFIDLLYEIEEAEYNFWRLQFKLKWDKNYYNPERMNSVIEKLTWCFEQLEYENPKIEAQFLVDIFDTIATNILRDGKNSQLHYKNYLKSKYKIK